MLRRISLYFEPKAWERLNRLLSLLMLSGKQLYDLPSMNDVVESMIIRVNQWIKNNEIEVMALLPYISGTPPISIADDLIGFVGDRGRMAFNVSHRAEKALSEIRERSVSDCDKGISEELGENVSDASLIRACVYCTLESENVLDFFVDLYVYSLYNLRAYIFPIDKNAYHEHVKELSTAETDNLRRIAYDEPVINDVSEKIKKELFKRKTDFKIDPILMYGIEFHSRSFNFNYYSAMIGYFAILESGVSLSTIPQVMANLVNGLGTGADWKSVFDLMRDYADTLLELKEISKDFNKKLFVF